jgi:hypothetical protein
VIASIQKRIKRRGIGPRTGSSFRDRYEALERRREQILNRLNRLADEARSHPGHGRARTLLNDKFRKATIVQRVAILQAAEWLIDVLETLTVMT